jgi:RNA polymerase sigma-70 factor (ECF subfamily)
MALLPPAGCLQISPAFFCLFGYNFGLLCEWYGGRGTTMAEKDQFLRVFLANQTEIRAFIVSLVRDPHAGDDLFQEVAMVLWEKFDRYDPARPFVFWARGIARNKIRQRWRDLKKSPLVLSPDAVDAVTEAYEETHEEPPLMQQALRLCLEGLPAKSRRMLALRYERSLKLKDIARTLETSVNAINQAFLRIRRALQACIEIRLKEISASGDAS